jgi:AraC-like DNA-binding protein
MTYTLLSARVLPELLEIALKNRINVPAVFEAANIDADSIGRADRFFTLEQLDALLSATFAMADNPYFGLVVGRENHHGKLDLLGNLLATSDTLDNALEVLLAYKNLLVPYLEFSLQRGPTLTRLSVKPNTSLKFARSRPHAELVVSSLVATGRSLMSGNLPLSRVGFAHAEPADLALYHEVFLSPIEFSCEANFLEVETSILDTPLASAYPKYHQHLRLVANDTLQQLARAQGVAGQVLQILAQRLGADETSIEAIASSMSMTPRTLQRRLAQEETTFAHLRDQVRHERACAMLGGQRCDMGKIAEQLGFSDTANFYHAFKRWEGCAPGEYRRTHSAGAAL